MNPLADLNALNWRQKTTVLTGDQLIPSRDWWPQWKPWVSSQGGPEKDRKGQAWQVSPTWLGVSMLVSGERGKPQSGWGQSLGSVIFRSFHLVYQQSQNACVASARFSLALSFILYWKATVATPQTYSPTSHYSRGSTATPRRKMLHSCW